MTALQTVPDERYYQLATDEQTKYIREEIIADYIGETAGEIWSATKRLPTHEEWLKIYQDANAFADELLAN